MNEREGGREEMKEEIKEDRRKGKNKRPIESDIRSLDFFLSAIENH